MRRSHKPARRDVWQQRTAAFEGPGVLAERADVASTVSWRRCRVRRRQRPVAPDPPVGDEPAAAEAGLNGTEIGGRTISVAVARPWHHLAPQEAGGALGVGVPRVGEQSIPPLRSRAPTGRARCSRRRSPPSWIRAAKRALEIATAQRGSRRPPAAARAARRSGPIGGSPYSQRSPLPVLAFASERSGGRATSRSRRFDLRGVELGHAVGRLMDQLGSLGAYADARRFDAATGGLVHRLASRHAGAVARV